MPGLPNRVLFRERLETAIVEARDHSTVLALLLVDLREFEQINSSFGHAFGDEHRVVGHPRHAPWIVEATGIDGDANRLSLPCFETDR